MNTEKNMSAEEKQKQIWNELMNWEKINNPFFPDTMRYDRKSLLDFGILLTNTICKDVEDLKEQTATTQRNWEHEIKNSMELKAENERMREAIIKVINDIRELNRVRDENFELLKTITV